MGELEYCEICGAPTGNAGEGEDSLYGVWVHQPPGLTSRKVGDKIGPLCDSCYDCLKIVGLIKINITSQFSGFAIKTANH